MSEGDFIWKVVHINQAKMSYCKPI